MQHLIKIMLTKASIMRSIQLTSIGLMLRAYFGAAFAIIYIKHLISVYLLSA